MSHVSWLALESHSSSSRRTSQEHPHHNSTTVDNNHILLPAPWLTPDCVCVCHNLPLEVVCVVRVVRLLLHQCLNSSSIHLACPAAVLLCFLLCWLSAAAALGAAAWLLLVCWETLVTLIIIAMPPPPAHASIPYVGPCGQHGAHHHPVNPQRVMLAASLASLKCVEASTIKVLVVGLVACQDGHHVSTAAAVEVCIFSGGCTQAAGFQRQLHPTCQR